MDPNEGTQACRSVAALWSIFSCVQRNQASRLFAVPQGTFRQSVSSVHFLQASRSAAAAQGAFSQSVQSVSSCLPGGVQFSQSVQFYHASRSAAAAQGAFSQFSSVLSGQPVGRCGPGGVQSVSQFSSVSFIRPAGRRPLAP